jgi:anaerobic selenocysteine-containing dehydrogenase
MVAMALGRLVAEARLGAAPPAFAGVDVDAVAALAGVSAETLQRLGTIFANAERPLAIPGGSALGQSYGLEAAQAILLVNILVENLGKSGGVFLTAGLPVYPDAGSLSNTLLEVTDLIERMRSGKVKVLFVHGANPVFELPAGMGFAAAMAGVPQVISFASFPDETAWQADYILPDHTPLESWGYQKAATGGDRPVISGLQPVVVPFVNTRATADVLLGAIQAAGGNLAAAVPYKDEVAFIQHALLNLVLGKGSYQAPEIRTFMAKFQQYGGWWKADAGLDVPDATDALQRTLNVPAPEFEGQGDFHLFPFMNVIFGDGSGVNRPWQQEIPDPTTTVMWSSWVEMNPATADKLGIKDDDIILITSPYGSVEASVYRYPAVRPDTIAVPFGQGHTVFGRYAKGRGFNTAQLFGLKINGAGDLAYASSLVKVQKTGRKRNLSRFESILGVYPKG